MNDPTKGTIMQNPEWVQENDWTRAQRGETVRLTNDDGAEATIVIHDRRDPRVPTMSLPWVTSASGFEYVSTVWQLFVQSPRRVALPTVPAAVIRAKGDGLVAMLSYVSDEWFFIGSNRPLTDLELRENFEHGFDVLEPVAETAKKVLNRVDEYLMSTVSHAALNDLRHEFGVTS